MGLGEEGGGGDGPGEMTGDGARKAVEGRGLDDRG
jgi:hypothetical protein